MSIAACVTPADAPWGPMMIDLPAPHACRAFKGSVVVGAGGLVTIAALSFNNLDPDNSNIALVALLATIGGGVTAGITSRSCFSQMNRAAERRIYRPPALSPEQKSQLDAVRAEEQPQPEPKP